MDRFGYVFEEGREENRGVVPAPIARNPSAGGRGGHWAGPAGRARLMASPSGSGTALPWANTAAPVRAGVPSLSDMCLDTLAAHADGLTSIQGVDIHLCTGLLYRIMQSRRCGSNTGLTSPASCSRLTFLLPPSYFQEALSTSSSRSSSETAATPT